MRFCENTDGVIFPKTKKAPPKAGLLRCLLWAI
jgi:hypothetical protein